MTSSLQGSRFSSRRRFLQQTLSGVAGWAQTQRGSHGNHRATAGTQVWQRGADDGRRADEVYRDDPLPGLGRDVNQRPAGVDPGRVDNR